MWLGREHFPSRQETQCCERETSVLSTWGSELLAPCECWGLWYIYSQMWFYITYEIFDFRVGAITAEEKSYMGPVVGGCVSDVLPPRTILLSR